MLTFVCFKWQPFRGYRSKFTGENVDILRRMIRRNYSGPHRFVCVTDDASGITEPDVEIYELWEDLAQIPNPSNPRNPSCYRRLKLFARNAGDWLGERFVCIDLDVVIVAPIDPLFAGDEPFRIWAGAMGPNPYNGSMWAVRSGAHPELWEEFDPGIHPRETAAAGFYGSDQGWFAYKLGPHQPVWTAADGVLSFRASIGPTAQLPAGARIVFFHGHKDPWDPHVRAKFRWVRDHYQ